MRSHSFAVLAAAAVLIATQASAFDHKRTELSLGYESYSIGNLDFDGPYAHLRSDFGFSPTFGMQVNLSHGQLSYQNTDIDRTTLGLHPYYEFGNSNRAGFFLQQTNASLDGGGGGALDYDTLYYGVEGMMNPAPNVAIQAYLGAGDLNLGPTNYNIQTVGLRVDYGFTPQFAGHFAADFDSIDTGSGDYSLDSYTLGVDYYLSGRVPMIITAEAGRHSFGGETLDRWGLSLTIPFGGGTDSSSRKLYQNRGVLSSSMFLP